MAAAHAEAHRRVIAGAILFRDFSGRRDQLRSESAEQHAAHAERRALQEVASRDRTIHAEVFVRARCHLGVLLPNVAIRIYERRHCAVAVSHLRDQSACVLLLFTTLISALGGAGLRSPWVDWGYRFLVFVVTLHFT